MIAVPHKKRTQILTTAGFAVCVSAALALICMNLDVPGQWFLKQDNLLEAMYCYQIVTAVDSMLGFRDWRLSNAWTNLAQCYARMGRTSDAMSAGRQARDVVGFLTGEDSVNVCLLDAELAQSLDLAGERAEAERLLKGSYSKICHMARPVPMARAYVLRNLVSLYISEKKYDQAEQLANQLMPIDDALQQQMNAGTFGGREKLVEIYCMTGRLAQADTLAHETVARCAKLNSISSGVAAHDCLARVLLLKGDVDGANKEFSTAIELLRKWYGDADPRVAYWRARYQQILSEKKPY